MKSILTIALLFLFAGFDLQKPAIGQAGEQEIRSLLESRDREIKQLVGPEGTELNDRQREELRSIVNDIIDFTSMATYALGSTFQQISADLQSEFITHFTTIVRDHSLNRLDIYRAEVSYEEIEIENGTAHVQTIAAYKNSRIPVGYTLAHTGSEWVITDMIIDNVSTAESYRTQFQSIIRQRGFDALMENLRRRAAQV